MSALERKADIDDANLNAANDPKRTFGDPSSGRCNADNEFKQFVGLSSDFPSRITVGQSLEVAIQECPTSATLPSL